MALAGRWEEIEAELPEGWAGARLSLTLDDAADADRAALVLGPLGPGRTGRTFRLHVRRGQNPARTLSRLDREGLGGRLELVASETPAQAAAPPPRTRPLADQWRELSERLPPDWSDLYAQIDLDSSDFLERGALLLAPVNPARYGGPLGLRFRCARRAGYGVAPEMAQRALERLDAERITGKLRPLRVLSGTRLAATQGPVWYVGGRSV